METVRPLDGKTLEGRFVALEPLEPRHHAELRIAGSDTSLFAFVPVGGNASNFDRWIGHVEAGTARGDRLAFVVRRRADSRLVGSTSYFEIAPKDARVEIGATWYVRGAQGTAVNPEAKYLLLRHTFEAGYNCVFLKTDSRNARSRAAILKLGAREDGTLRGHMWMEDQGYFRDTVFFSILRSEWPEVRARLEARLAGFS